MSSAFAQTLTPSCCQFELESTAAAAAAENAFAPMHTKKKKYERRESVFCVPRLLLLFLACDVEFSEI